jgi:ornithine cyclodeaminase/alanine dehydrogenase-like protein (mu-crystallin family)
MRATINIVETALRELALGKAVMPQHTAIHTPASGTHWGMSAYLGGDIKGLGFELLSICPENPQKHNLPPMVGQLMLSDPETGVPLAFMDATFLTAMRSGAVGAVAAKYLAQREVKEVAIFGTGRLARIQLMGICAVRQINGAVVVDSDAQARQYFADMMSKALGIPIEPVEDVRAAVEMADVIITATSTQEPLFRGEWLCPGVHINAVGNHSPDAREVDTATVQRAKVVPDLTSVCLANAGDLILPIQEGAITEEHIHADLGQVVAGSVPGRESDDEITLFKSVGLAVEDVATAIHVYNLARRRGVGTTVNL